MSQKYDVWCHYCGCIMKLRKGKYGFFWGCTGFPLCRNTMNERDAQLAQETQDCKDQEESQ